MDTGTEGGTLTKRKMAELRAALERIQALAQGQEAGIETPAVRLHVAGAVAATALSDRYDAAHPESEHDGGLGSGDWLKERNA